MNRQQILKTLEQFCGDFTLDEDDALCFNGLYVVRLLLDDNTMSIVRELPSGKFKIETFSDINTLDDVIDVWSEFMAVHKRAVNTIRRNLLKSV